MSRLVLSSPSHFPDAFCGVPLFLLAQLHSPTLSAVFPPSFCFPVAPRLPSFLFSQPCYVCNILQLLLSLTSSATTIYGMKISYWLINCIASFGDSFQNFQFVGYTTQGWICTAVSSPHSMIFHLFCII